MCYTKLSDTMLNSEVTTDTETQIKLAARKIFLQKGLAGTRLQEIADEAGIGRTALHYYFRSKEKLFAVVWKDFFGELAARMLDLNADNYTIVEKMQLFAGHYMDDAMQKPEVDIFLLNEFNKNPALFQDIQKLLQKDFYEYFKTGIAEAVKRGEMIGNPEQIFLTFLSSCMFPFAGMGMIKSLLNLSDKAYLNLMKERKQYLIDFLANAFKA